MYYIVEFTTTKEVAVVPAEWEEDGVCSWPTHMKSDRIQRAVKKAEMPTPDWTLYSVTIRLKAESYDLARARLREAEEKSDLQSDANDDNIPAHKKRKRTATKKLSSDESSGESEDELDENIQRKMKKLPVPPKVPKPPQILIDDEEDVDYMTQNGPLSQRNKSNMNTPGRSTYQSSVSNRSRVILDLDTGRCIPSSSGASASQNPDRDFDDFENTSMSGRSTPPSTAANRSGATPIAQREREDREVNNTLTPRHSTPRSLGRLNHLDPQCSPILREILVVLEEMRERQRQDSMLLHQVHNHLFSRGRGGTMGELPEDVTFPLTDRTSMMELEEKLEDGDLKKRLISHFGLMGGADVKETVWRILGKMIENDLAKQINWMGTNGKSSFKNLTLRNVLVCAVRKNALTSNATDDAIEGFTKRWFQLAGDRNGGRKAREDRKKENQAENGTPT